MGQTDKVGVGIITHRRPDGFRRLLASLVETARPENADVVFLIAENGPELTIEDVVSDFRGQMPEPVLLDLEQQAGIPFARNKVLDMALAEGCDYLTFLDDDEWVDATWLGALIDGIRARDLDLVGGPVRVQAEDDPAALGFFARGVLGHTEYRADKRIRATAQAVRDGTDGELNIYTNNWCARLSKVVDTGVRFDEARRYTGGSDTRFSLDMKAAGGRIGWVPDAYVTAPVATKRLTLRYHFGRARDQAINTSTMRETSSWERIRSALALFVDATLLVLFLPVTGSKGLAKAVHKYGAMTGTLMSLSSSASQHYAPEKLDAHIEKPSGEG